MRVYRDRIDAGERLAAACEHWRGQHALVLGIPRGGVPVAAVLARALLADLDLVVARKVGAPLQPEFALGAVTADGGIWLDERSVALTGASREHVDAEIHRQMEVARERERSLRGNRPRQTVTGRVVIVVDDGLATGSTMHAAVDALQKLGPTRIVVAVPVGSIEACDLLARRVDELICPWRPPDFRAVGLHYVDFRPTTDEDVRKVLQDFDAERAAAT